MNNRKRVKPNIKPLARELRQTATFPERLLWSRLRKLDELKFRRQHPINNYVADFYCAEKKLIIEIDGISHEGNEEIDTVRTEHLNNFDFTVIRFLNDEILQNLEGVVSEILRVACSLPSPPPSSPNG